MTLRSQGKAPELWRPDTGSVDAPPSFEFTSDGRTRFPLWLEPNGSVFVILRRAAGPHVQQIAKDAVAGQLPPVSVRLESNILTAAAAGRYTLRTSDGRTLKAEIPSVPAPVPLDKSWTVHFTPGWGAPESATFQHLASWTENPDPGIRYYSGTAVYSTRFPVTPAQIASGRHPFLDLGDVREIAQVKLNGKDLGILWKKPFEVALDGALKPGANLLEISVTNLWPNRLIGDQRLPPEQRRTHTNITKFHADSPLMPSGLVGPVTLRWSVDAKIAP